MAERFAGLLSRIRLLGSDEVVEAAENLATYLNGTVQLLNLSRRKLRRVDFVARADESRALIRELESVLKHERRHLSF